jgi:hypothetical protein
MLLDCYRNMLDEPSKSEYAPHMGSIENKTQWPDNWGSVQAGGSNLLLLIAV